MTQDLPGGIFIVGTPRSGTTWLLSILGQHPDCLAVTPEMLGINVSRPTMETGLFVRGFSDSEILQRWNRLPVNKILVEKTPAHIKETDRIRKILGAKIILIHRDPSDVIFSMLKSNPFWENSPTTIKEAIKIYNRFNVDVTPDYTVKYENLWIDTVNEVDRLFSFIGLSAATTHDIINATKFGRNLPLKLKSVFDKGTPGQGRQLPKHFNYPICKRCI